jgi:predicted O-methyltransferase YrrM
MLLNIKEFSKKYNLQVPKIVAEPNIQGWGSDSEALQKAIDVVNPQSIVEVGTWLGASALFMGKISSAHILCVDTFLASNEILWREGNVQNLVQDFNQLYNQFCANITNSKMNKRISVLPMTSSSAAELLEKENIMVDMVYIDAGHREREVYADLQDWWPLTKKVLVGDDYNPVWDGVISAADRFASENQLNLQILDSKFLLFR